MIDILVNTDSSPASVSGEVAGKLGEVLDLGLYFTMSKERVSPPVGVYQLEVKERGQYAADPLLRVVDFSRVSGDGDLDFLKCVVPLDSVGLRGLFTGCNNARRLMVELVGTVGGDVFKTEDFELVVYNDVVKSLSSDPLPIPPSPVLSSLISSYDGGEIAGFAGGSLNDLLEWLSENSGGVSLAEVDAKVLTESEAREAEDVVLDNKIQSLDEKVDNLKLQSAPLNIVDAAFELNPSTLPEGNRYLIGTSGVVDNVWYQNGAEVEVVNGAFVHVGVNPYNSHGEMVEVVNEREFRIAGDEYNGVLLPIGNKSALSIPQDFQVGVTSNYRLTNLEGANLGFPSGGWLEVDMRGCDLNSYSLGKMTLRSFSGLSDLVRYSDQFGLSWTSWDDNLVTTDGVVTKLVHFDETPTHESLESSNPLHSLNREMGDDSYRDKTSFTEQYDLSILTNRSSGGSVGGVGQNGLTLNTGSSLGSYAMVTMGQVIGHGGQNGGSQFDASAFPFILHFAWSFQPNKSARYRVMIGQPANSLAVMMPDDGSQAGIIVEIESDYNSGQKTRVRLGVSDGTTMTFTPWEDTTKTYKSIFCRWLLHVNGNEIKLQCISRTPSFLGFDITHPNTLPTGVGAFATLQITNEYHLGADQPVPATNSPAFLTYLASEYTT